MKKFLSIVLSILMVVTMLPIAIMPASAAYDYDETTKLSFQITNLVREWKGETEELGESGSGFYEQSLTKVADGKYKYTYRAALSAGGGTWWSDPKTVTFDGVDCESDYYKTFDFTESTPVGGYTMRWTYTLEVKRYKGHTYSAWSDNGDGTHTRTCQVNSTHVETLSHDWVDATCVEAKYCKTCGLTDGEALGHNFADATCISPEKCTRCGVTQGEINSKNHASASFAYEPKSDAEHYIYRACCKELIDTGAHDYKNNGYCKYCGSECGHASYTDGYCDVCGYHCSHIDLTGGVCQECGMEGEYPYIYRKWNSTTKSLDELVLLAAADTVEITSDTASLTDGWYIVKGTVTLNSGLNTSGSVNLILADNSVLNANSGIYINSGSLSIYAQSDDLSKMGKINAKADPAIRCVSGQSLTIHGGNISAISSGSGAGIGGEEFDRYNGKTSGTITINGGYIYAQSKGDGAGIGSGYYYRTSASTKPKSGPITINGGTVNARSVYNSGAGIGGGRDCKCGSITINGGNIKAAGYVEIGNGEYADGTVTIKNSAGGALSKVTYTLAGLTSQAKVTEVEGISYGLGDVYTHDTNKLYFYLPSGAEATSITAGGVEYICNRNLTYYTEHEYTDATCITPQTCQYCGHTVGEATFSHNYVNGVCTVCGMGEADGIIYISTAEQLMMFADYVNYVNKDADAVLMADIDLAEYTWTPIGVTAMGEGVTNGYTGSFDGNGHVIRNVTFATPTSAKAAGIFGTVQYGGTVRNLGVESLNFDNNTYDHRAGGIAGQLLADSTISDCYVINSTVKASSRVVGGIVGMNNGTVKNCYTYNMTLAGYNNRFGGISGDFSAGKLENCYTDYSALASSQAGTATNCKAGVSADVFASGEIAYLLNGSTSDGDLVWGQLIGTDSYPAFGGETVYYSESKGYYNILHTCDFSGEWKYDADKHWKECTADGCDKISEEAGHTYTDGKCDCGYACPHSSYTDGICDNCDYECPHEWGKGVLTRPTFETAGYYTYTCTLCGHSYTEPTEKADTTALNDASMKVMEYIDNNTLTQEARDEIYKSYRDILKNNGNIFDEFGFVRGDLVEEDQPLIDAVTEELQKIIDEAEEKIASGEYVKADYTSIDNDIYELEYKLENKMITDEGKSGFEEIKKQLNEMKADENTSKSDLAELEKALREYEAEIDKGIEDGTLVKFDGEKVFSYYESEVGEALIEKYGADFFINFINKVLGEKFYTEYDKIYSDACTLTGGTMAENAENIAQIKASVDELYGKVVNCIEGVHNGFVYEVTEEAKCGVNAIESATCTLCGETDEREIEGTALEHSFTKYEETEAPKCGVAGKEVAYCDNGCQTTDERETPALEHIFLDYVSNGDATCTADGTKTAECIHGCGTTDTVAEVGTKLDHADEDGDKLCDDCGEEVYDRCDICGGKAHGDDKIQILFCVIITIIRVVTSILKSIN